MMTLNQRTVTLKLTRSEVCDLLIACTAIDRSTNDDNTKWSTLHDHIKLILDAFDEKLEATV